MRDRNKRDNVYQEGTIISAKENPSLNLVITKYNQRIYFCDIVGQTGQRFAYFEHNLISPLNRNTEIKNERNQQIL
jgi:hypothetical protein